MVLTIKLFGHLVCLNENLESFGQQKFMLELSDTYALKDIHNLLNLSPEGNWVSIVDGRPKPPDYLVDGDCTISIFPPMTVS